MSTSVNALARPPEVVADQHRQAMAGFVRIMALWGVGNPEMRRILGAPPERTLSEWKSGRVTRLPADTLRRIGYVAGIYHALQILYSDDGQADRWVQAPNRHFGGQTPIARMAAGDVTDLAAVRAYLDAARDPWS